MLPACRRTRLSRATVGIRSSSSSWPTSSTRLHVRPRPLLVSVARKHSSHLPPRPKLDTSRDLTENFVKGTGPGGQKINKTASAVQLIDHATGIVIKCQATRSRQQNRALARAQLAERLEQLDKGEASRAAQVMERAVRKKASASKKSRRKYRKLAEAKAGAGVGDEEAFDTELDETASTAEMSLLAESGGNAQDAQPSQSTGPDSRLTDDDNNNAGKT